MLPEIKFARAVLVVDHEDIGDVIIPNQKSKVPSLKEARRLLLEDNFEAVVFLSLLEEANEIETFVKGLRAHPKLSTMPIFCEYGLMLALPKDLGLIAFEEATLSNEAEGLEDDDVFNDSLEKELEAILVPQESKSELINEFKDLSAKALVLLEQSLEVGEIKRLSREAMVSQYLSILRRELGN